MSPSPQLHERQDLVIGMPGEHGFYVHADLRDRTSPWRQGNATDPTVPPAPTETQTSSAPSAAEDVDLARQGVAAAFEAPDNEPAAHETVSQHFDRALGEIRLPYTAREPYSRELAEQEHPLTHYTRSGNIFQVLRFGIQSHNFKNRINASRAADPELDGIASEMSGFRIKQGRSHQERDSISVEQYRPNPQIPDGNISILINPNIKTFGSGADERDPSVGFGHGIVVSDMEGDFSIGNLHAYSTELLVANIVPPSDMRAIIVNDRSSILQDIKNVTRDNATTYNQARLRDPQAATENLLANCRLLADLSGDPQIPDKIDELATQLDKLERADMVKAINDLQLEALRAFVGPDAELNEQSLRTAIQSRFNIEFLADA